MSTNKRVSRQDRQGFKEDLMKQMVIIVGAPASGKSFFVENTFKPVLSGANLNLQFPRFLHLSGGAASESDNSLRQLQYEAAKDDFRVLGEFVRDRRAEGKDEAEIATLFNGWLRNNSDFKYTPEGAPPVYLADVLAYDDFVNNRNTLGNYFAKKGDPVNKYYMSMRGRGEEETSEGLKDQARKIFEDNTTAKIQKVGDIVIIDCAGEDIKSTPFSRFFDTAKREDFAVTLVELNIPLELSLLRNELRGKKGRKVPEPQVVGAYKAMQNVVGKLRKHPEVDRYVKYVWKASGKGPFDGAFVVGIDDRTALKRRLQKLKEMKKQAYSHKSDQKAYEMGYDAGGSLLPVFGDPMKKAKRALGHDWTPETERAWKEGFRDGEINRMGPALAGAVFASQEDAMLRNKLIRLAHAKPELQPDLLPLIKEAVTFTTDLYWQEFSPYDTPEMTFKKAKRLFMDGMGLRYTTRGGTIELAAEEPFVVVNKGRKGRPHRKAREALQEFVDLIHADAAQFARAAGDLSKLPPALREQAEKKQEEAKKKKDKEASTRKQLIRLAHAKPELRPKLLPLIKKAGGGVQFVVEISMDGQRGIRILPYAYDLREVASAAYLKDSLSAAVGNLFSKFETLGVGVTSLPLGKSSHVAVGSTSELFHPREIAKKNLPETTIAVYGNVLNIASNAVYFDTQQDRDATLGAVLPALKKSFWNVLLIR